MLIALLFSQMIFAQTPTTVPANPSPAVGVMEAKEKCKKEGKAGKDLLDCVRASTK